MKKFLSEKNLVVVLFVLVLVTFALAQEDSKKMERAQTGLHGAATSMLFNSSSPAHEAIIEE